MRGSRSEAGHRKLVRIAITIAAIAILAALAALLVRLVGS